MDTNKSSEKRQNLVTFGGVHVAHIATSRSPPKSRLKKHPSLPKICDYAFGPKCLGKKLCIIGTGQFPSLPRSVIKKKRMPDNLKVAVRVRPFNDREKARNATLVLEMMGNTTKIIDPNGKYPEKKFTFDFSYWSHDGYREREDGYLEPAEPRYADQAKVFEDLGQGVLDNAWKGFNCSLFAYGQTGSGKSYSMVGYNVNKGIIPVSCERLFAEIDDRKNSEADKDAEYQVSVSMLEIYNETVKDLLNLSSFKKGGLRVREHPQKGFFVEQLKVFPVSDYAAIEGRIAEGTRNRTLAATNMNATSSRAHTIVAITFTQKAPNEAGESMTKTSVINLVDLAGSERADSTGATGERLKEGSMINKSLLCLGNCIKALAESQGGKTINVPFRDSTLTRLLKNALGGNSKTVMIAALSPADINYDETVSTLRFADRAKSIKTKAVVNESPTDKLIREMKGEIERLQQLLKAQAAGQVVVQGISEEEVEEMRKNQEAELQRNQEEMENMNQTWQERLDDEQRKNLQALEEERTKQEARKTVPNLWNLNEDPMLSGMIVHLTPPGISTIGNADPAQVILKGLGIQKDHAVLENNENSSVYITPSGDSKVLVNGKPVKEKTELHHNDRIMFGSNQLYVLHHPQDAAIQEKEGKVVEKVSFDTAQEEIIAQNKVFDMDVKGKSADDILLQEDLIQIMPMINEANAMSEEMDRKMVYDIALLTPQARGLKDGRTEVFVKAKNLLNGNEFFLSKNDFENRRFGMQEMYQDFMEEEDDWEKEQEGGYPFRVAVNEPVLIGTAYLYIQSFAYLMDIDDKISIQNYKGKETGLLSVSGFPHSQSGEILDEDIGDPSELIGRNVQFKIEIKKTLDIPKHFIKVWCRFKFFLDDEWHESDKISGSMNFDIGLEKMFKAYPITKELLDEMENSFVMVQVWGEQSVQVDDPSRSSMSTRELMAKESSITLYKPDAHAGAKAKAVHENKELRRKESEINHLHSSMNTIKSDYAEMEKQNAMLKRTNEANQKQMEEMQRKLHLITNMVNEAQRKGEKTLLVARLNHILRTGQDLTGQQIQQLEKQLNATPTPHVAPPTLPPPAPPQPASQFQGFPPPPTNNKTFSKSSSSSSSSSSGAPTPILKPPPPRRPPSSTVSKKTKSGVCSLL